MWNVLRKLFRRGAGPDSPRHREPAPLPELGPGAGYSPETIATAVLLVRSTSAIRRMVDEVTFRGTAVHRTTTIDFVVEAALRSRGERLVIPLTAGSRGQLWDTSDATCDGAPLSVLVHAENAYFAQAVIEYSWAVTVGDDAEIDPAVKEAAIAIPSQPRDTAKSSLDNLKNELRVWRGEDPDRTKRADELEDLVAFFTRNYIVFAEVPASVGDRFVVVRRVAAPYEVRRQGPLCQWRTSAGLRPVTLTIPLYGGPARAMSYHLRVKSPDGYHVHLRELLYRDEAMSEWVVAPEVRSEGSACRPPSRTPPPPHHPVLWSDPGGDYAHLYLPNDDPAPHLIRPKAYVAKVKFSEDLPGSIVGAFVPAAMLALLTVAALVGYDRVFPFAAEATSEQSAYDQANSSFAAFLLAIPGVTALWFRPRHFDELVRLPLISLAAPFINGMLSFLLAATYLAFRLSPCVDTNGEVNGCDEDLRLWVWSLSTAVIVWWAVFLLYRVVAKRTSEEPCRPPWGTRFIWWLLRKVPPQDAIPRLHWWQRLARRAVARARDSRSVSASASATSLDRVYEQIPPTSKRGDIFMTRADSFDFPFSRSHSLPGRYPDVVEFMARVVNRKAERHHVAPETAHVPTEGGPPRRRWFTRFGYRQAGAATTPPPRRARRGQ